MRGLFTESLTSTALDLNASAGAVDLAASNVTAPTTATSGQQITVNWQVTNQSSLAASGNWQDSVYLSPTSAIGSGSVLLGAVQHSGGLAAGAFYNASLTAALPAIGPGTYYLLVDSRQPVPDARFQSRQQCSRGRNRPAPSRRARADPGHAAKRRLHGGRPGPLLPGHACRPAARWSSRWPAAPPPARRPSMSARGSCRRPTTYQEAPTSPTSRARRSPSRKSTAGTPITSWPTAFPGAAATAGYTLTATQTAALTVSGHSPASGGNAGNVTIEIDGTNFTPTATASLTLGGTTITASAIDFVSASQIFATFNLTGAAWAAMP